MAWSVRNERRAAEAANRPCVGCGHSASVHRELVPFAYELNEERTAIVQVPNPDHRPGHFHCDQCGCVVTI